MPPVLKTKSSVLLLLVFVWLFLRRFFVLDVSFSFSEILNLLSFLASLSFKPGDIHPPATGWRLFMWIVVGPLGFLLNSFTQSSISEL